MLSCCFCFFFSENKTFIVFRMDQAIAYLGEKGRAKKIDFDPLRAQDVSLPSGYIVSYPQYFIPFLLCLVLFYSISFVIASSMVEANKYATSQSGYNMRYVCFLATLAESHCLFASEW